MLERITEIKAVLITAIILITRRVRLQQQEQLIGVVPARLSGREWRNSADTQASTCHRELTTRTAQTSTMEEEETRRGPGISLHGFTARARACVCVHGLQTAHVVLIERVWVAAAVEALMEAIVPHVTLY